MATPGGPRNKNGKDGPKFYAGRGAWGIAVMVIMHPAVEGERQRHLSAKRPPGSPDQTNRYQHTPQDQHRAGTLRPRTRVTVVPARPTQGARIWCPSSKGALWADTAPLPLRQR